MVIESCSESEIDIGSEKCIILLKQCIDNGYSRDEALEWVAQEMGIDANEMLTYMQHYLLTKGKVKVSSTGTVTWYDVR